MNSIELKTFTGATMNEALTLVKTSLGPDAVILHTRSYCSRRWLGLRRREVYEITAGRGMNVGANRIPRGTPTKPARLPPPFTGVLHAPLSSSPAATLAERGKRLLETPAASGVMLSALTKQVCSIQSMVEDLARDVRSRHAPNVAEELLEHYLQLIENDVAEELAADIVKTLQKQLRTEHLQNSEFVREKIAEQLEKLVPVAGPIVRTKTNGAHIVALIGPTGVGKTTTIAKLAANLKLREKRKVGLITLDTYRIAAIEQLKKYADIIGSTLKVVGSNEELKAAIADLSDCDYILIDTAGRSPKDALKISELKTLLATAAPDEVHLVLSSTSSQECVELASEKFSEVKFDRMIFTKLDEAAHVGTILNVVKKLNKSLSYVTTGQDVPDDIEVGQGRRLARLILGKDSV